jgi:pSer/pThr/pTyr-binding forkhead associated (FHA) protein
MLCPNCGAKNREDAKFCKSCGAPLNGGMSMAVTLVDKSGDAGPPPAGLEVMFLSGLRQGERVLLTQFPATVGRDPNSALPLALHDQLASTRHALIRSEGHAFILRDVGSSNGTYLNGQRITEAVLSDADVIEFGIGGPQVRFMIVADLATHQGGVSANGAISEGMRPSSLGDLNVGKNLPEWAKNAPIPPNMDISPSAFPATDPNPAFTSDPARRSSPPPPVAAAGVPPPPFQSPAPPAYAAPPAVKSGGNARLFLFVGLAVAAVLLLAAVAFIVWKMFG